MRSSRQPSPGHAPGWHSEHRNIPVAAWCPCRATSQLSEEHPSCRPELNKASSAPEPVSARWRGRKTGSELWPEVPPPPQKDGHRCVRCAIPQRAPAGQPHPPWAAQVSGAAPPHCPGTDWGSERVQTIFYPNRCMFLLSYFSKLQKKNC